MITVSGNNSKTRRFQEQLPPAYLGQNLDFNYSLSLSSPGSDLTFGLKSSDGTIRSQYTLKSGMVFDYLDRFITTYQSGINRFNYGLKKELIFNQGVEDYYSYQSFNGRLISTEDVFSGYEAKPFDRFFINNSGSENVNFDLSINGFAPPTQYSTLVGIGSDLFSGNLIQSDYSTYPSQGVPYGLLGVSLAASDGSVHSFQTSGSGQVHYIISGNNLADGQSINVEFDTLFGRVSKTLIAYSATPGPPPIIETAESGIYLSLYGASNLIRTKGTLEFGIDYYSNYENDMVLELETDASFSNSVLSGSGAGFLNYSGFVRKSGLIYSMPNITGTADLSLPNNLPYNTAYSLVDTKINISAAATSRTTGVFFTGINSFKVTGVTIVGTYDGPYPPYVGTYLFSGLGDVIATHDFVESDEGVYLFNESWNGYLNPSYSDNFYITPVGVAGGGIPLATSNKALFPTGVGAGAINYLATGEGIVTKQTAIPFFFGQGTGKTYTSRVEIYGSGTGDVSFVGNAYDWSTAGVPVPFTPVPAEWGGASCDLASTTARGRLASGVVGFYGTGAPSAQYKTWGFPTGPSNIVIAPMSLEVWSHLSLPSVTGGYSSSGSATPITFGFTGWTVGYIDYPGTTIPGPVFPSPNDTGLYPYNGNGAFYSAGESYYGRGCIFSSGGSNDGTDQFGIYVLKDVTTPFEVEYNIESGGYFGIYAGTSERAFIPMPVIRPAMNVDVDGGKVLYYDRVSLEFPDPVINRTQSGLFYGYGYLPSNDLQTKFNLYYSEEGEGLYPERGFREEGWFSPTKFSHPFNYEAGFKKGYAKVSYTSADEDSSDEVILRVTVGGVTGQVDIITNRFAP